MRSVGGASLHVYAPNIHTGGGAVLLDALLDALPSDLPVQTWLDERGRARWVLKSCHQVHWVKPTLASRWRAERGLHRSVRSGDRLLCLHGLPPLLRSHAHTTVFQQNRLLFGQTPLSQFALRTRLRLYVEQQLSQRLRHHVDLYWVQTETMADALRAWWGDGARPPVRVLGFAPTLPTVAMQTRRYDFIYVADGEAHKNHRRLLEAWSLLAEEGIRPSLALTLSERDSHLRNAIEATMRAQSLRIEFLPKLSHDEVLIAYAQSGALVFPSLTESYGLPLVEAASLGLPIIASERDFVREVCEPAQTFDPESPRSIARAVRRHLGLDAGPAHPATAAEFLRVVFP